MNEIRALLPESEQKLFDDIVYQKVLGASKHIQMIGQMFLALADKTEEKQGDAEQLEEEITKIAEFFKSTRGEASRAISNAINIMLREMGDLSACPIEEAAKKVRDSVEYYAKQSEEDILKAVCFGVEAAGKMNKIMVFDYSGTVNAFIRQLGEKRPGMEIFIPESRTINGGYGFVSTALKAGMKVHFIPDAAIMYFLKSCDGAFFGAETLYADGTVFNTTGSDIVGLVCRTFNIPLFVLTPMIKLDMRPVYGYQRELVANDLRERMALAGIGEDEVEQVDFICPELLPVLPEYIKGVITEFGIIPAGAVYPLALHYDKKLNLGDVDDE